MLGIYCRTSRETDIDNSTISQQRNIGIKFAEKHSFDYEIYEDEGKSGFKISDNDQDPFENRPEFARLINDIKTNKVDKVWVWEDSRLSRNTYANAFIFHIFEKYKIKLFVKDNQYELTDPQVKLNRTILGAVSEYERHLIVNRTSRGQKKQFAEGRKVHQKLFCYKKNGRDNKGHVIWEPVESEVETYMYMLKRYKEGASLRKIVMEVKEMNGIGNYQFESYAARMGTVLRKYQYTGYQLNDEGSDIFKKFRNYEINNLQVLKNKEYWIKSIPYPLELISIDEWVEITERLQIRGSKMNLSKKEKLLKANRDIGTGIINCGECNARFYYKQQKSKIYPDGHRNYYYTYFHKQGFISVICKQLPKSFKIEDINEILKIFYFFFLVVFDNRIELMEQSQRNIKQKQIKTKEKIIKLEKEASIIEKRVFNLQKKFDENIFANDLLEILLRNIKTSEDKLNELNNSLSKTKIEYELLCEKFSQNLLNITYYDVVERINNWFFNLTVEEQRNELIRTIDKCLVFNHHLLIEVGTFVFLFDVNDRHKFDMKLLENLNKDKIYKDHFIELKNRKEVRKYNSKLIPNLRLDRDKEFKMRVFQYLIKEYNIVYDLSEKTNLIPFVPLSGLYGFDLEQFGNEK